MPNLTFDEWYRQIEPAIGNAEITENGEPRHPHLIYERAFAQSVLAHMDGLNFSFVHYQREMDIDGRKFRIDFTIEEPGETPIAIEVDGTNKYDGGTRPRNPAEHRGELDREHAIQGEGFLVFHFANTQVRDQPEVCRDRLAKFVRQARRIDRDRNALGNLQAQVELEDYESMRLRLTELESQGSIRQEEHQETLRRIADLERLLRAQRQQSVQPPSRPLAASLGRRRILIVIAVIGALSIAAVFAFAQRQPPVDSASSSSCERAEPIPADPQDLATFQDQRLNLRGIVKTVVTLDDVTYLNMNADYLEEGHFAFKVNGSHNELASYEGQEAAATGTIVLGEDTWPQLRIEDPSMIALCG